MCRIWNRKSWIFHCHSQWKKRRAKFSIPLIWIWELFFSLHHWYMIHHWFHWWVCTILDHLHHKVQNCLLLFNKTFFLYPNIWKQFQSTYESLNRHILQWQLWHFLPRERADNSLKQTHKLQNEYFNAMQSIMYWMNTIAHTHTHKYVEVFDIHYSRRMC